jgi:uncharacterized integral membrane protein
MRRLRSLVTVVPAGMLFIVLATFALENVRSGRYDVLGTTLIGSVWWIVMGSALLGFLIAALLFVPGRVASEWRSGRLSRQAVRQEADLTSVRAQDAQHQVELRLAIAERNQQRSRSHLATATVAAAGTALSSIAALVDPERAPPTGDTDLPPMQPSRLRDRLRDMVRGMHPPCTLAHSRRGQPPSPPEAVAPRR